MKGRGVRKRGKEKKEGSPEIQCIQPMAKTFPCCSRHTHIFQTDVEIVSNRGTGRGGVRVRIKIRVNQDKLDLV